MVDSANSDAVHNSHRALEKLEAGETFSYFAHECYTPGRSYGSTTDSGLYSSPGYTLFPPPSTGEIASIQDGNGLLSLSSHSRPLNRNAMPYIPKHLMVPQSNPSRPLSGTAQPYVPQIEKNKEAPVRFSESLSQLSEPNRAAVGKAGGGGEGIDTGSPYTLYCGNLPDQVDEPALQTLFQPYGPERVMLAYDGTGRSKGHGFVIMNSMEKCKAAIKGLHGMALGGQPIIVCSGSEREDFSRETAHRLYVGNLDCSTTAEELHEAFNAHGGVTTTKMLVTKSGKRYGFVWYSSKEEMERALTAFDGMVLGGQQIIVRSRPEREDFSRETAHKLYVGNLDCSTTAEELHESFNAHGGVTTTKMFVTKSGKCYGFVWYSSKEEMERALTALDGMELKGQVLQVQLSRSRGTPPLQDQ